jgi:RNA polymerase sigma-70 factor (ECF subfamily)
MPMTTYNQSGSNLSAIASVSFPNFILRIALNFQNKLMTPVDLKDIAYRIAGNDHSALKWLYDQYNASFYHLAFAIVHSAELAEEIVEDVFIQVWRKRTRIATVENLHLYLYVTTRNISRSYLRKYRNQRHINFDNLALPHYRLEITPEDIMISGEVIQRVNNIINDLPSKCRLIFKLVKEDGLKHREVAELLHLNVKTVENQIGIALKKIHAAVKVHLPAQTKF